MDKDQKNKTNSILHIPVPIKDPQKCKKDGENYLKMKAKKGIINTITGIFSTNKLP